MRAGIMCPRPAGAAWKRDIPRPELENNRYESDRLDERDGSFREAFRDAGNPIHAAHRGNVRGTLDAKRELTRRPIPTPPPDSPG